jgi:hypothetical protein
MHAVRLWWTTPVREATANSPSPSCTQKARGGKKKHRLVPGPVRGPIVLEIFEDYWLNGMGLGEICDKLNADLER